MLALAHLYMNTESTVTAQVRAEIRERLESGESSIGQQSDAALEAEVAPVLRYDLIGKHGFDHLAVLYTPRFILPNVPKAFAGDLSDRRNKFVPFQNGGFGLELERPRYRVMLYGFAAYGSITTSALLLQKSWLGEGVLPGPQPILPSDRAARFTLLFYQPQFGVALKLRKHITLTPSVRYASFGGADGESRATIPATSGPQAQLNLDIEVTRRSTFKTMIGAAYTSVLNAQLDVAGNFERDRSGAPFANAQVEERYVRKFSRTVTGEIAAGAIIADNRIQGTRLYPTGEANVQVQMRHTKLAVILRSTPWVNLFAGEFEPRTELSFGVYSNITTTWVARLQATGARTLGNADSISRYTLVVGDGAIGYRLSREVLLEGGARGGFQDFSNANLDSQSNQFTFYGAFSYTPTVPLRL